MPSSPDSPTSSPALSLVVPTYNERDRLAELVDRVCTELRQSGIAGELIVVDDNSPDGTGVLAESLAERYPVRVIRRPGKQGLGTAVVDGFEHARAEVVGVLDADMSHPPAMVPVLFAGMRASGCDAIVGSRYIRGGGTDQWPFSRLVLSWVACLLAAPLTPVRDATSGLFLIKRHVAQGTRISAGGFKICLELLVRSPVQAVAEMPYRFVGRTHGESKMNLREAAGYLRQLWNLYRFRFGRRGHPRVRYVRLPPR